MKKLLALVAISGITAFYACSNAEKQEETTTEQTTTEQTTTEQTTTEQTSIEQTSSEQTPAQQDSSANQTAPATNTNQAEGQH